MARIFVVEDDASLREELMRLLELQGHTALTGTAFDRIVDDVLAAAPDCVILDLKLPGTGGHTVCRDLRRSSQVPVIMLTSSDSEFDEVLSMNLGADDYVTKPYNPAVLLARIQSVLRRTQRTEPPTRIEHRGVVLDISRQELMVELWQSDAFIDDNTLTVNINRLRKSLASIGVPDDFLVTRRGQGYVV